MKEFLLTDSQDRMAWRIFILMFALSGQALADVFDDARWISRAELAPRDIAEKLGDRIPGTDWRAVAWRENTVLLAYTMIDAWGRESAGWYLADVDAHGELAWWAHTFHGPDGQYALEIGQGMDVASTLVGLSQGFVEANPIGAPGAFSVKAVLIAAIRGGSAVDCMHSYGLATQAGWAAAGWNAALILGGPVAGAAGAAIGAFAVSEPSENDIFWECAPR